MQKFFLIAMALVVSTGLSFGQKKYTDLSQEVPFDKEFRKGVLPNGLTYYIRHNETPKGRASFYIYQNVGAVLEKDEQDGLAHFLEHMAFNGTTTFPNNTMLDMLERHGVKFGKDVNAYTSLNETVYNISRVPTANDMVVDSCIMILRDWCNELSLDVDEIDAERGVIHEEWRTRQNAGRRIQAQLAEARYNGAIYARRDVLGSMDVVRTFDPQVLRDFYHDWYRTDLQAVAVIGDIDVDAVEKRVIELFSAIPAIENPKERVYIEIPDNKEPLYAVATEQETKNVNVTLMVRHKKEGENNTLAHLRENFVNSFFNALMNSRLKELKAKGDAPFIGGKVTLSGMVKNYGAFTVSASAKEEEISEAVEAIYTELLRVQRHGFTEGELSRLKTNTLVSSENKYLKSDKINSDSYGNSLKQVFLHGSVIPDAKFNYEFTKEIVPTITKEEVSAVASKYLTDINRVYTVIGSSKEGTKLPTLEEIEAILAKAEAKEIEPYVDNAPKDDQLLSTTPKGGKVVSEKKLETFDAEEWTLSNGAKVVYRFADFQKNTVALSATSEGGSSVYELEDLPSVGGVTGYMKSFGIGKFNPSDYKKVMTGNTASSGFSVSSLSETVYGSSTTKDVETMLQLVYMRFEEPRFDKEKFDQQMEKSYEALETKIETEKSIKQDTLRAIFRNGNPRVYEFSKEYLDAITFEKLERIYRERFSDASDFTFFIVGDVKKEVLKPLVEKYIGAIKDLDKEKEAWVKRDEYELKGKNEYRIEVPMASPKASVMLKLTADTKYSRENIIYHAIIGSILDLRFTENIREKESGTYGVSVKPTSSRLPESKNVLKIGFDCDPEKADYLKSLVYKELKEIQKNVSEADLEKVVLNMKKNGENRQESNAYWMKALSKYYDTQENILEPAYYDEVIENVTTKDIEKAAKRFFKKANVIDIVFVPEEAGEEGVQ
ncbi:insulinase family protein [Limibacter armeniacum]|uniref:M16 family metallopeptidase n=1 Tax=Limibacter armeniacum TaxID=466084 RepID=UPI002FE5EE78